MCWMVVCKRGGRDVRSIISQAAVRLKNRPTRHDNSSSSSLGAEWKVGESTLSARGEIASIKSEKCSLSWIW